MLRLFQNINFVRITIFTLTLIVLCGISFLFAYGRDEGTLGDGVIKNFIANVFVVLSFPSLFIFDWLDILNSWEVYFMGLFINALLYAIILERLLYLFHATIQH